MFEIIELNIDFQSCQALKFNSYGYLNKRSYESEPKSSTLNQLAKLSNLHIIQWLFFKRANSTS